MTTRAPKPYERGGTPIVFSYRDLPALMQIIQRELRGLRARLDYWGRIHCPEQADALVAQLDVVFAIG